MPAGLLRCSPLHLLMREPAAACFFVPLFTSCRRASCSRRRSILGWPMIACNYRTSKSLNPLGMINDQKRPSSHHACLLLLWALCCRLLLAVALAAWHLCCLHGRLAGDCVQLQNI